MFETQTFNGVSRSLEYQTNTLPKHVPSFSRPPPLWLTVVAVAFRARCVGESATLEMVAGPSSPGTEVSSDGGVCSSKDGGGASFDGRR
ncbi:hypothetical protein SESBI_36580 [Sesbania bispinosa]|nr:hypothetical protein SESBI_36580 [Sesbania bispinosa]